MMHIKIILQIENIESILLKDRYDKTTVIESNYE